MYVEKFGRARHVLLEASRYDKGEGRGCIYQVCVAEWAVIWEGEAHQFWPTEERSIQESRSQVHRTWGLRNPECYGGWIARRLDLPCSPRPPNPCESNR
jgi:hypothetical protein